MQEIKINASLPYSVFTGKGLLINAGNILNDYFPPCKVMIVTDSRVFSLYGENFTASLKNAGYITDVFTVKPGDTSKSAENLFALWNTLSEKNYSRSDVILSLGGGVVSDLGGFAAATYMRGIRHIIFPTTLLSMADAGVGGKTAINLDAAKNIVGTFYFPTAVFCDTDTLNTLPSDIYADGMSEIIKCGIICSEKLLGDIDNNADIETLIAQAIQIKKHYTELDEKDTGLRHMLNFGHTLAHAAETLSGGSLSHGSAVAMGMYRITQAAVSNGLCDADTSKTLLKLLKKYNLPYTFPYRDEELCKVCINDKKRLGDTLTLVIPVCTGITKLYDIKMDSLSEFLSAKI